MNWSRFCLALILAGIGCGGVPPLESLSLRDALGANPEIVAALSADAQRELAQRLVDADGEPIGSAAPVVDSSAEAAVKVQAADAARLQAGQDSVVVAACQSADGHLSLSKVPVRDAAATTPLPKLEGAQAVTTADLEQRSLDGAAGKRVREIMEATGATRLQRVVGWPSGAISVDGVVYVNAAWLVALSALEPKGVLAVLPARAPPAQTEQQPAQKVPASMIYGGAGDDRPAAANAGDLGDDVCNNVCSGCAHMNYADCACSTCTCAWEATEGNCLKCQTAGGRSHPRNLATVVWVLLPFGYLWWASRRRRV